MSIRAEFAREILKIARQNKMTLQDLSNETGISRSLVQRWTREELYPSEKNLIKLERSGYTIEIKIKKIKD